MTTDEEIYGSPASHLRDISSTLDQILNLLSSVRKQTVLQLKESDGEYHNFITYGGLERKLETHRLVRQYDLGLTHTLIFEELPPVTP